LPPSVRPALATSWNRPPAPRRSATPYWIHPSPWPPGMLDHDTDSYHKITRAVLDGQPAGQLTADRILDNITLYWLTGTGASAARAYWESGRAQALAAGQAPPNVQVPVGFTTFPDEIFAAPRSWVEQAYPTCPTSTRPTRAATSPPGRSPSSSQARSGPRSGHCARSEGRALGTTCRTKHSTPSPRP
jgi:hypothetical protein